MISIPTAYESGMLEAAALGCFDLHHTPLPKLNPFPPGSQGHREYQQGFTDRRDMKFDVDLFTSPDPVQQERQLREVLERLELAKARVNQLWPEVDKALRKGL